MTELLSRQQYAMCACGCGWPPPIAKVTVRARHTYAGEPMRCVYGHGGRVSAQRRAAGAREAAPDQGRTGYCGCGCGGKTAVARKTDNKNRQYHSQPQRFLNGHWAKWRSQQLRRQQRPAPAPCLCTACFQHRPAAAIVNGVCCICLLRRKRQAEVDQRLQDAERERVNRMRDAKRRGWETMRRNKKAELARPPSPQDNQRAPSSPAPPYGSGHRD
jgi:hypothetical protein